MAVVVEQRARSLRLDHRALRSERVRVAWWRRLVRAQLDLVVARTIGPQALGEDIAFQLPIDIGIDVPRPAELAAVLDARVPGQDVLRLEELRALDRRLARYQDGVEQALLQTTDALIDQLATAPEHLLGRVPDHASRD